MDYILINVLDVNYIVNYILINTLNVNHVLIQPLITAVFTLL